MKKDFIMFITIILSLLFTFLLSNFIGLYTFGTTPTTLTIIYLISIFSIIEYLFIIISYLANKKRKKLSLKKIISFFMFFISLVLILFFIFVTNVDWLNFYSSGDSAPFYITIIKNSFIFLVPSLIFIIIGIILFKKKNK